MNRSAVIIVSLGLLSLMVLAGSGAGGEKSRPAEPAATDDLTWFPIDGGGGTSTGGEYSLSGTIGQPDAGILTGGDYRLNGGFWLPLEQLFYLTHVASTDFWWTRFTLLNAGEADNPVLIYAYNAAGDLVESLALESLPPGNAWQADVQEGCEPATLAQDLWVIVSSPSDLRGILEFGTRDGQMLVVNPILRTASTSLVYPYVVFAYGWWSGLTLINAGNATATVQLMAYTEGGELLSTRSETVARAGKYVRMIDQAFPDITAPETIRLVKVTSDQPLVGFELFGNFSFPGLAGLPAYTRDGPLTAVGEFALENPAPAEPPAESPQADNTLFYNELLENTEYYTGITFLNLAEGAATFHAELYDYDGNLLAQQDWSVASLQQITREVWFAFDGTIRPTAAYVKVTAPVSLLGFELFLNRTGEPALFRFDGVTAVDWGKQRQIFPMIRCEAGWMTHVRLTNPGEISADYTIRGYGDDGAALWTASGSLSAGHKLARSLEELLGSNYAALTAGCVWMEIESTRSLIGHVFIESESPSLLENYMGLE